MHKPSRGDNSRFRSTSFSWKRFSLPNQNEDYCYLRRKLCSHGYAVIHSKDQHKAKKCFSNTPTKVREQLRNETIAKKIIHYFYQKTASHDLFN